jgi:hypothetical protein
MQLTSFGHPNGHKLESENLTIWFSYETPIAFQVGENPIVVVKNYWGQTTGKHLNATGVGKNDRVTQDEFDRLWNEQVTEKLQ